MHRVECFPSLPTETDHNVFVRGERTAKLDPLSKPPSTSFSVPGTDLFLVASGPVVVARSARGWLYFIAQIMGDVNAVKKGRVGRRIGRRVAGKYTGRGLGRLFR